MAGPVLILIAAGFLADFVWGRWAQAAVTKLVVDLGEDSEAGTLRARLAYAGPWRGPEGRAV